ncbi:hypothetical protein RB195_019289 [Necator americanus]|uniref:Uncharacterized protein n=1 Tax=Necator americanus TaxID=51031 RepID=A0ABR1CGC4_NECAM
MDKGGTLQLKSSKKGIFKAFFATIVEKAKPVSSIYYSSTTLSLWVPHYVSLSVKGAYNETDDARVSPAKDGVEYVDYECANDHSHASRPEKGGKKDYY